MAGNVFEWTATQEGGNYVVRGGGWSKYYFRGRVADRGTQLEPNFANYDIGFRCAR
jgi:formylglycine-generating enzyme required for sulfatase activity